jgi:hypothetical protein
VHPEPQSVKVALVRRLPVKEITVAFAQGTAAQTVNKMIVRVMGIKIVIFS